MEPANPELAGHPPGLLPRLRLAELVPIAAAAGAGCEECTQRLVRRALERGAGKALVERTLAIAADLRSHDCFERAVGPEGIARMAAALEAGKEALGPSDRVSNTAASAVGEAHHQ